MLPVSRSLLAAFLLLGLTAATAHARLGDTMAQLKKQFGSPEPQSRKNVAVWFFEIQDGRMIYTVTFNAKGQSIAEGLKPIMNALFTSNIAQNFIEAQVGPFRDSKTLRTLDPGEKYTFAGQAFSCGAQERVLVDEANDFLIIWTRTGLPAVMAVRREMMH